ncbi:hepatitis A virus cellular receptor 1 homolog [Arapaima gigas]
MNINRVFISSFVALYYLSFNVTDSEARQTVKAAVGQNVTLPCVYNVKENGLLEACWGRGEIPLFKCTNTVIAADGNKVTMRLSDRYQLLSGLDRGNVSLTIINVAKEDSGLNQYPRPGKKQNLDSKCCEARGACSCSSQHHLWTDTHDQEICKKANWEPRVPTA